MTEEAKNSAVDNLGKLDNLYQLARRARNEKNMEKSAQYYEQILLEEPNSWEAIFYSAYYAAIQKWRDDDKESALALLRNCIGNVTNIISGTNEEYAAVMEITAKLSAICSVFYESNKERFEAFYSQYSAAGGYLADDHKLLFLQYLHQTSIINERIASICYVFGAKVLEIVNNKNGLEDIVEAAIKDAITTVNNNPCNYVLRTYASISGGGGQSVQEGVTRDIRTMEESCRNVRSLLKQKREAQAKQSFKEYWDSHPDEKIALESEKQSLTQQITNLNDKDIPAIPGYIEMNKLNDKVNELISEKKALGFFKFKEKKTVQQQIDSVNIEIESIQSRINPAITEIRKLISEHENRIKVIDTELTKPR
jgi:hypothetical protein